MGKWIERDDELSDIDRRWVERAMERGATYEEALAQRAEIRETQRRRRKTMRAVESR